MIRSSEISGGINALTGVGVERPALDLGLLDQHLVDDADLLLTYENLLCRGKVRDIYFIRYNRFYVKGVGIRREKWRTEGHFFTSKST